MSANDARKAAVAAGLNGLTEADLGLLAKSLEANRALSRRLPQDLHWSEEIAPVLRLEDRGARGDAPKRGTSA